MASSWSSSFGLGACRPVGTYSKGDKLGEGTYGSVYQARDKETGRIVALKRVKEQSFESEGMPQTSIREIALLRRLRHPHIVSLIEVVVGSRADSVFLVFEYCAHELAALIDALPPFPLPEVKCLILQLLGAVAYLHANGILHRDLKMSNLLLTAEGMLKLCDFGLAREHSSAGAALTTPRREAEPSRRCRSRLHDCFAAAVHTACRHPLVPLPRAPSRCHTLWPSNRYLVCRLYTR